MVFVCGYAVDLRVLIRIRMRFEKQSAIVNRTYDLLELLRESGDCARVQIMYRRVIALRRLPRTLVYKDIVHDAGRFLDGLHGFCLAAVDRHHVGGEADALLGGVVEVND